MLGLLGWGVPARIMLARSRALRESEFVLLARATGVSSWRLLSVHVAPNLWPVMIAQFWIALPVFILAEANLSLLGLGVAEPLPSLGSLLREMESVLSIRGRCLLLRCAGDVTARSGQSANCISWQRGELI